MTFNALPTFVKAATAFSSSLNLKKGWHRLSIRYFQAEGDAVLQMKAGTDEKKLKDMLSKPESLAALKAELDKEKGN